MISKADKPSNTKFWSAFLQLCYLFSSTLYTDDMKYLLHMQHNQYKMNVRCFIATKIHFN